MTKFTFGDRTFTKKVDATKYYMDYFKAKLDNAESLSDADKTTLKNLVFLNKDIVCIENITDFRLIYNKFRAFEAQYKLNDLWIAFSIKRCIVGKGKTDIAKISKLLRESVNDQVQAFRYGQMINKCQLCSSSQYLEVDHMEPIFSTLVKQFIGDDPVLEELNIVEFQKFHREKARFRFLCSACNSAEFTKRGRKKVLTREEEIEARCIYNKKRYETIKAKAIPK